MRSIVYAAEQSGDRGKRKAFRGRTDVLSVPAKSTCPGFFVATSTHSQCCVTHTHTFPSSFNSNERVQTADLERGVCVPLEKSYFFHSHVPVCMSFAVFIVREAAGLSLF